MNILVVGHARSGTTYLIRTIQAHPEVKQTFFEHYIMNNNPKGKIFQLKSFKGRHGSKYINCNLKTDNMAEKILYTKRKFGKGDKTVLDYCDDWNEVFGDNSRIIHIVRYPLDTLLSHMKSLKKQFGGNEEKMLKQGIKHSINFSKETPAIIDELLPVENIIHIKFEDFVLNQSETLKKIFKHCGLTNNKKLIEKLTGNRKPRTDRTFAYRRVLNNSSLKGHPLMRKIVANIENEDMNNTIESLNRIHGIKYKPWYM